MSYFWKISLCINTTVDLKIYLGHNDLYFKVSEFSSFILCSQKHFSFIGKVRSRQVMLSFDSSYLKKGFSD